MLGYVYNAGTYGVAVIDFGGVAEAGASITFSGGGLTKSFAYTEVTSSPSAALGQFAKGASAAAGATNLAAAINGDTRYGKPKIRAFVSAEGDSVVVVGTEVGINYTLATDSAANVTVESMHNAGIDDRTPVAFFRQVVTAQDVKANEVNIPVPFVPVGEVVSVKTAAGADKTNDSVITRSTTAPYRVTITLSGSTDLAATDVVSGVVFG